MHLFLAAIPLDGKGERAILLWSLVLGVLVLLAFGAYSYYKKWMTGDVTPSAAPGFGLSDLKKLRNEGKISAEEYDQARAKMVAAAKRMTESMPDVLPKKAAPKTPSPPSTDSM